MILLQPIWLLLLIPLGASLWLWRMPTALLWFLRLLLLTLILLAMTGLAIKLPSRVGTVVVIADRSRSMPTDANKSELEAIHMIEGAMGENDRLAVVSFGQSSAIEQPPVHGHFGGFAAEVGPDASNLADALDTAISLIPPQSPARILVLSDGRYTGRDPTAEAARAAARAIGIDHRNLHRPAADDLAIERIDVPNVVAPGESFMISAWIHAPLAQEATIELVRDGVALSSGSRLFASGHNRVVFRDRAKLPGTLAYSLRLSIDKSDPVPENNIARALVSVSGQRPILAVTHESNSGLAPLLKNGLLDVRPAKASSVEWSLETLSGCSAVLLENVPAPIVGSRGMETLAAWVQSSGGGLMITGGRNSYGPGGYFQSALDPIIPVSMELRQEHRKLAVSLVVALDRSGSMTMPVGGGKNKMDMADAATAKVIDLLSAMDEICVLAVDTEAHEVIPLQHPIDKAGLSSRVLSIESKGGGIYVYEALLQAAKRMERATNATRHIILFADAADAEVPGDYPTLVAKLRAAGVTITVIGLGTERDPDAAMLKDLAQRGGGRCIFSADPLNLPQIFAQEAFVIARSTFVDEATAIQTAAPLVTLAGRDFGKPPNLGGYNLTYLKPQANLAALTLDEYKAPVIASWHAGVGRVLAYTGEADGKFTGAIAKWDQVGNWYSSMARWAAGDQQKLPEQMLLTQEVRSGVCIIELHVDPSKELAPLTSPPKVTTLRATPGESPKAEHAIMHWVGPDTLALEVALTGSQTALSTVEIPGQRAITLAPVCLPYSPEYEPIATDTGQEALDRLAAVTGGVARATLPDIWKDVPHRPRFISLEPWLLIAAAVVLLLEVLQRRTGLLSGGPVGVLTAALKARRRQAKQSKATAPQPDRGVADATHAPTSAQAPTTPSSDPPKTNPSPPPTPAADDLMTAMRKARRRAD